MEGVDEYRPPIEEDLRRSNKVSSYLGRHDSSVFLKATFLVVAIQTG
jgi:hypothetical protein